MQMDDWISLGSAVVAVAAMTVAGWQAREARRQAKAAEDQVKEARRSAVAAEEQIELMRQQVEQAASWRANDERRAEPQFRVTARPFDQIPIEWKDNLPIPTGESFLSMVEVLVENISSRDATINHVGIEDLSGGATILGEHELGIEFPCRLAAGHQIEILVPANEFFGFLGGPFGLPEESEFVVFAAKSFYESDGERWDSQSFTVRLPSFHPNNQKQEEGRPQGHDQ